MSKDGGGRWTGWLTTLTLWVGVIAFVTGVTVNMGMIFGWLNPTPTPHAWFATKANAACDGLKGPSAELENATIHNTDTFLGPSGQVPSEPEQALAWIATYDEAILDLRLKVLDAMESSEMAPDVGKVHADADAGHKVQAIQALQTYEAANDYLIVAVHAARKGDMDGYGTAAAHYMQAQGDAVAELDAYGLGHCAYPLAVLGPLR